MQISSGDLSDDQVDASFEGSERPCGAGGAESRGAAAPAGESRTMNSGDRRQLRIGVNALYLIPGGVGGTEIYLRCLLPALAEIDRASRYFVFLNQETGRDIVPAA